MRWLAWAACLGLAAVIAVAAHAWQGTGITTQLQPIDHALVSSDGRQVTVPALGGGCIRRVALTATETPRTVLLRLTAYSVSGPHVACPANLRLLQASTRLGAPLGERDLIDASTHHSTPYIPEGDLAHPAWLPRGATGPTSSPIDGWTRTFTFPKRKHRAPLTIVETPKVSPNALEFTAAAGTISRLTVHGHPATLAVQRQRGALVQVRIGWHVGGYALTVVSQPRYADQRPFSPAVIKRVAAALDRPAPQ